LKKYERAERKACGLYGKGEREGKNMAPAIGLQGPAHHKGIMVVGSYHGGFINSPD
jgi:hypothetical protein